MHASNTSWIVASILAFHALSATAAPQEGLACDARTILEKRCATCHDEATVNAAKARGDGKAKVKGGFGFVLDPVRLVNEAFVTPGKPESSLVHERITDAADPMPPTGLLSEAERDVLRRWIAAGAKACDETPKDPVEARPTEPEAVPEPARTPEERERLAQDAHRILRQNCAGCHAPGGKQTTFEFFEDPAAVARDENIVPGHPERSLLYKNVDPYRAVKLMPPRGVHPRPGPGDVVRLWEWIAAGAPPWPKQAQPARPFVSLKQNLVAIRDHLRTVRPEHRRFQRYFTFTNLHNLPTERVHDEDLRLHRAALAKLLNSLSWRARIVVPEAIDEHRTVYAIDLRELDWHAQATGPRGDRWELVLADYPYGLRHDHLPDDEALNDVAKEIYDDTGTYLPFVRADWFVSQASIPPLYHDLLGIPEHVATLERRLGVDPREAFSNDRILRAGFTDSGVSQQNRMVERYDARDGAYWRSYDFLARNPRGNLYRFPLGPEFHENPFQHQAFREDGGEIIFNLPNGLQGYMLIDGAGRRIDRGPIQVVYDDMKVSGNPEIVNGLSCMACHDRGMKSDFRDRVREATAVGGDARQKVRRLYREPQEMERLLQEDTNRFLQAVERACGAFLREGGDARPIDEFPEPISRVASWYHGKTLDVHEAAAEFGIEDASRLVGALASHRGLETLGLKPWAFGGTVSRPELEVAEDGRPRSRTTITIFQAAAQQLRLGTPFRP